MNRLNKGDRVHWEAPPGSTQSSCDGTVTAVNETGLAQIVWDDGLFCTVNGASDAPRSAGEERFWKQLSKLPPEKG